MHYVQSITNVLTNHLGWHRARLKFIARFQAALLKLQTTNLSKIAVSLKGGGNRINFVEEGFGDIHGPSPPGAVCF